MGKTGRTSTLWAVWAFLALYALLVALQAAPGVDFPLDGATYALMFVVGAYVGTDQFASFIATRQLPSGTKYTANHTKLTRITVAMFLVAGESLVVQWLLPEKHLPLNELFISLGVVVSMFAGGAKAKTAIERHGPLGGPTGTPDGGSGG